MKTLNQIITEMRKLDERCWPGYKPTPGKKPYEKGSCMKEQDHCDDMYEESEHDGKKVTLNKPFRTPGGPKKFSVYVKNDKGNVVKVNFGDPDMEIKRDNPERRASYRARHNCSDPGPKWKANYWSCKMWSDTPVSKITEKTLDEVSPTGKDYEDWIKKNKAEFIKRYGLEKGKQVLYARAWKMKNKFKTYESHDTIDTLDEVSPSGKDYEDWIKKNKARFIKQYGPEKGKQVLYARAWAMKNKFKTYE